MSRAVGLCVTELPKIAEQAALAVRFRKANAAFFMSLLAAAALGRLCLGREPQRAQREGGEAEADLFHRLAARDGLGHAFGQFVEFVLLHGIVVCLSQLDL